QWGQVVVVENQPGASGGIGTRAVAKAEPDGYTLLMASTGALVAGFRRAGAERAFRRQQIFRADHRGGGAALSAGGQSGRAGQHYRRVDHPRARETESAVIWFFRHRG